MSISNNFNQIKPAVFLDRDGTINIEKDYLYKIEELELIPGTIDAIRLLNQAGFLVIVVTNQSGIARGFYSENDLSKLHQHLDGLLSLAGARVAGWYYCPHHTAGKAPYNIICECRKPLPGMLLQAAKEHAIDLSKSWMVGDKLADIEAGLAAGCQPVLVRTGYGSKEEPLLPEGVKIADNLLEAAGLITVKKINACHSNQLCKAIPASLNPETTANTPDSMDLLVNLFKGLSDPIRMSVIGLLLENDELCVCELVAALALPQSTVSRHLAYLRRNGWLDARQAGLWKHYRIADQLKISRPQLLDMLLAEISLLPEMKEPRAMLDAFVNQEQQT